MIRRARRLLTRIHDSLAFRCWCDPDKGIIGHCQYDQFWPDALGLPPICTTCKRERPR